MVHDLHQPAPQHLRATGLALVERDPLRFWRALALGLALLVVVLAGLLVHGR